MSDFTEHELPDGTVSIFAPDPTTDDIGRMYVLDVFGASLLIRERPDGLYVHLDKHGASAPSSVFDRPLFVEVDNGGEQQYGDQPDENEEN